MQFRMKLPLETDLRSGLCVAIGLLEVGLAEGHLILDLLLWATSTQSRGGGRAQAATQRVVSD